ncbi:MAG TPA: peptidylprolyl isomerase [Gemmatimonadaceae bacterium]|nr:peptidylprolyl isomerase [Gemmatimonadaceae bacterium]
MKVRILSLAPLLALIVLSGCEAMRDALTAHTGTVARAESQELTATRLGELVGGSEAPMEREVVRALADIWVNYQLLGTAAARGDSLNDSAVVDSAMWSQVASSKARQFYSRISEGWGEIDSAGASEAYQRGDLLAAQHILLLTQNEPDSVKRTKLERIRSLRARATPANFADLATANSEDQASARRGGSLGVFPRGMMVPEFEQAVVALEPGAISDVIETQFGYHVIRRHTFPEIREDFLEAATRLEVQRAESTFTTRMDAASRLELRSDAAARAKAAAADLEAHRNDRSVLATSAAGSFTTGRLVQWLQTFPPQQQIVERLQSAPDSAVEQLVRNFVRNELVVRAADSAGISVDAEEMARIRSAFSAQVEQAWMQLRVHPSQLTDSATTPAEREQLAARRVDAYIEAMLTNRVPFIPVMPQLQSVLRSRYDFRINTAGIDRAVQTAQRVRAADVARRPPESAIPLPQGQAGQQPEPAPPGGAAPGAPAPGAQPPAAPAPGDTGSQT